MVATGAEVIADDSSAGTEAAQASQTADTPSADATADLLADALTSYSEAPSSTSEIVFIDTSVDNLDTLIGSIDPDFEIILLDTGRDGVEQIADILSNRSDLDAIHIISHGSEGILNLGTANLSLASMNNEYFDELLVISNALSENADLLIYGCNFGEGVEGGLAAARLAQLTGSDVAASIDPTGHADLGGDWDLELVEGVIETDVVVSDAAQDEWHSLLANEAPIDISVDETAHDVDDNAITVIGTQTGSQNMTDTLTSGRTVTVTVVANEVSVEIRDASNNLLNTVHVIGHSDPDIGGSAPVPVVVALPDGGFIVVTQVEGYIANANWGTGILGQVFDADGNLVLAIPQFHNSEYGFLISGDSGSYNNNNTDQVNPTVDIDGGGVITVSWNNVSSGLLEQRQFSILGPAVSEGATTGTVVTTLTGTDPDGDALIYSIVGGDSNFEIIGDEIRVKVGASLDYDVATSHTLTIRATDTGALTYDEQFTIAVTHLNIASVGLPTITGTVTDNQTLTADTSGISDADGLGAFSYQWLRDGGAISGATASTYTLGDADIGALISVEVSYTDGYGTSEGPLTSAQTAAVVNINEAPTDLSIDPVSDDIASNSITIIGSQTGSQFTTATLTSGNTVTISVSGSEVYAQMNTSGGTPIGSSFLVLGNASNGDINNGTPNPVIAALPDGGFIVATQVAGYVDSGNWGEAIIAKVYDAAGNLVTVTPEFNGGSEGFILSNSSAGNTDQINATLDVDADGMITASWNNTTLGQFEQRTFRIGPFVEESTASGTVIATFSSIDPDSSDTATYSLVSDPSGNFEVVGDEIRLKAGATIDYSTNPSHLLTLRITDSGGLTHDEQFMIAVIDPNTAPVGLPAITGTITEDQTLTADTSGISDADGLGAFSYQWLRDGGVIAGATASTYTLVGVDVGALISVEVSYTDGIGTNEGPLTSVQTAAVANLNDAPTFDVGDGAVVTNIDSGYSFARDAVLQSDGKIITVGYTSSTLVVTRHNTDGTIDTSFGGGDGIVSSDFFSGLEYGYAVELQSDGKILVAGRSATNDFLLVRYNTDGTPDTSFGGGDGVVTTDFSGGLDFANDIVVQADGKIVLAGRMYNGSNYDFAVVRYLSDGSLDTSFSGDGKVDLNLPNSDSGEAITLQSDGKILVAGSSNNGANDFTVFRLNTDGSLDTSFSGDGIANASISSGADIPYGIAVQSDGKILLAGNANDQIALARFNTDGTIDTSFSGDGSLITNVQNYGFGSDVKVQSDGKILVAGSSHPGGPYNFVVTRYNSDGSLDTSFGGGDGIVITDINGEQNKARSLIIQPNGKIIVAGEINTSGITNFGLVRYNSDGTLDTDFDLNTTLGGAVAYTEDGAAVVLDSDVVISDDELDALNSGNGNYSGATVTLTRNGGVSSDDVFSFSDGNGITLSGSNLIKNGQIIASFDTTTTSGQLVVTFTNANGETPTSTNVDNIVQQITYANSNNSPPGSVQVDWLFNDGNSGSQGSGGALTDTGNVTVNITAVNDAPVGIPTITGTVTEGQTLTADTSGISDGDGLGPFTYQWLRNGGVIAGATASTYTLGDTDVGTQISVRVSYTDGYGTNEGPLISIQTATINSEDTSFVPTPEDDNNQPTTDIPEEETPQEPGEEPQSDPEDDNQNEEVDLPDYIDGQTVAQPAANSNETPEPVAEKNLAHEELHGEAVETELSEMVSEIPVETVIEAVPKIEAKFELQKLDRSALAAALDKSLSDLQEHNNMLGVTPAKVSLGVGGMLSAGVVSWVFRGGTLLSALLATVPTWKRYDPLIVLSSNRPKVEELEEDELSKVERVFESASKAHNNSRDQS
jgi:uncharacterized delta-60 repeat protein